MQRNKETHKRLQENRHPLLTKLTSCKEKRFDNPHPYVFKHFITFSRLDCHNREMFGKKMYTYRLCCCHVFFSLKTALPGSPQGLVAERPCPFRLLSFVSTTDVRGGRVDFSSCACCRGLLLDSPPLRPLPSLGPLHICLTQYKKWKKMKDRLNNYIIQGPCNVIESSYIVKVRMSLG